MARVCDICGKRPLTGNMISHSARKTKRRWYPNLQAATIMHGGRKRRVKICTKCLKSGKIVRAA